LRRRLRLPRRPGPRPAARELAPDGINVFFDNVGGEQFEAAVQVATPYARFALCGALGSQLGEPGETTGPGSTCSPPSASSRALRPFARFHTPDQIAVWNKHFAQWLDEGRFVFPHTVVEGGAGVGRAARPLVQR
ncbi:NADP-dependent oxidoreductase, partial [Streptomyces sp. MNU103]|nr:NADP-dependent oxidoreductase [Streptomyces sp. MNU103]